MHTDEINSQNSVVEETVDRWLNGWSGLKLYVEKRRAGQPADSTMETLLTELVRSRVGNDGNTATILMHLFGKR